MRRCVEDERARDTLKRIIGATRGGATAEAPWKRIIGELEVSEVGGAADCRTRRPAHVHQSQIRLSRTRIRWFPRPSHASNSLSCSKVDGPAYSSDGTGVPDSDHRIPEFRDQSG